MTKDIEQTNILIDITKDLEDNLKTRISRIVNINTDCEDLNDEVRIELRKLFTQRIMQMLARRLLVSVSNDREELEEWIYENDKE